MKYVQTSERNTKYLTSWPNRKKKKKITKNQSKISFFLIPRLPTCSFPRVLATIFSSTYLLPCMVILMYKSLYVFSCINPLPAFQYSRVYNFSFSPLYPLKLAHYQAHGGYTINIKYLSNYVFSKCPMLVSYKINIQSFLISPFYDLARYLTADSILLTTFSIISTEIKWMIQVIWENSGCVNMGNCINLS